MHTLYSTHRHTLVGAFVLVTFITLGIYARISIRMRDASQRSTTEMRKTIGKGANVEQGTERKSMLRRVLNTPTSQDGRLTMTILMLVASFTVGWLPPMLW